jgi:hypothetical protein
MLSIAKVDLFWLAMYALLYLLLYLFLKNV